MMNELILAIESSCDDSSLALMDIQTYELKYYSKISQEIEHAKYGGVVPELAARLHTKALPDMLEKITPFFSDIKAVAVTNEPGLSVSLASGVAMAKSIALSLSLPLIAINHLIGHIYSLFLDIKEEFPMGVLLVSGGHTMILYIDENSNIDILAKTSDDSFGESFDKVAKMMRFGYPGGVIIENLAKNGDDKSYSFTVPLLHDKRLQYSFSGLKNQVRLVVENLNNPTLKDYENIAASFQKTACMHICDKLEKIFSIYKFKKFGVVGGASANILLRSNIEKICSKYNSNLYLAPLKFCSDNAAMIARAAVIKYKNNNFTDINNIQINPKSKNFCIN